MISAQNYKNIFEGTNYLVCFFVKNIKSVTLNLNGYNSVQSETFLAEQGAWSKVNLRNTNTLQIGRENIFLRH
ncbi:MAG: hypothetical protein EGR49_03820 [Prevotella sp.]|nr:hypothetical protein [Prevotella sp.]